MSDKDALDKAIVKEAIQEWLDKQFASFGKWSLTGIACALAAWLFYAWLSAHGWHK
jgi:hypothetical protein